MPSWGRLIQGRDKRFEACPSQIDPVMSYDAVCDVHDLDQVDLVALRRLTRILPDRLPPVG
jgi:hypothetical protein